MKLFDKIKLGLYHASYHRNYKKAVKAKDVKNIYKFKKYIYKAEDAWRKLIIISKKYEDSNE